MEMSHQTVAANVCIKEHSLNSTNKIQVNIGLVGFYGISNIEGDSIPNSLNTYN